MQCSVSVPGGLYFGREDLPVFDAAEIIRRVRAAGLTSLLTEMRALDRLLRSRCPETREVLLRDGYLFPIHHRLTELSRCIASAVDRDGPASEPLERWIYLHAAELAEAFSTEMQPHPDECGAS